MARKKRSSGGSKRVVVVSKTRHRRKRVSGTAAVGRTHHKRKRRVSGTAAVGKTRKRRKRSMGSTASTMNMLKEVGKMALGATGGVMANNLILMPVEKFIVEKAPMAGKAMGFAQAFLGGWIAIKSKGNMGKAFGLTILGGGAQAVVRQFKLGEHIPGISGPGDEYTTLKIPISGPTELRSYVAGVLQSNESPNWPKVAGQQHQRGHRFRQDAPASTNAYSGDQQDYRMKTWIAGEEDDILPLKGLNL
jgi:hypothetical protein